MCELDQVIDLWNQKVKGAHKTVRIKSRFHTPEFLKKFEEAKKEIGTLSDWAVIIDESLRVFDDPWWECRRLKQGFDWLFQRRNKGQGELNWIHFYELGMDRLESQPKELFTTSTNTEELP